MLRGLVRLPLWSPQIDSLPTDSGLRVASLNLGFSDRRRSDHRLMAYMPRSLTPKFIQNLYNTSMMEARSLRDWTESASHNRLLDRAAPLINPYALEPTLSKPIELGPESVGRLSICGNHSGNRT